MDEQTTQTAAVEDGGAPVASQQTNETQAVDAVQALAEALSPGIAEAPVVVPPILENPNPPPEASDIAPTIAPETVAATATASAEPEKEPEAPEPPPPFTVANRSRAQRLAKIIYGPTARVWIGRDLDVAGDQGIHIGTEVGSKALVSTKGKDFTEALRKPVEEYIAAAPSYKETKARIREVQIAGAENVDFALDALKKWPEYQQEVEEAAKKRVNPILAKIASAGA